MGCQNLSTYCANKNKATLTDLIAATGLVILLKLDSNQWFFILYDLEIRWMTLKNNKAALLGYIKLCALFQSHQEIQTGVTIRKYSIQVKIHDFFVPCDLDIWWMTLKNNKALFLCYFKLCLSFHRHSHRLISTGVTVWKHPVWVKISDFFCPVWPWNLVDDLEKQ